MSDCRNFRNDLAAYLSGDLSGDSERGIKEHLAMCPKCKNEFDHIKKILKGADALHEDIRKVMDTIDWDALPGRIAQIVFEKEKAARPETKVRTFWKAFFQPRWRPLYAGVAAGLVLGVILTLVFLKPGALRTPAGGAKYYASNEFIDRVELQMAKRDTLDYLERSEYLILDFIQSPPGKAQLLQKDQAALQAKDLLSKKRYINQQLDRIQMAKAKEICNQIELLFLELSQISADLSAEEIAKIQSLVEQKQLLLKIKLLKKEIEKSEV
jgi:hypothetical protein